MNVVSMVRGQPVSESAPEDESSSDLERTHTCQAPACIEARAKKEKPKQRKKDTIPSAQIGAYVEGLVQQRAQEYHWRQPYASYASGNMSSASTARAEITRSLGVNDRRLYSWRSGEVPDITLVKADEFLVDAGIPWWEVWNERTVRIPALSVMLRGSWRWKESSHGTHRTWLTRDFGLRHHGDLGQDEVTLHRIRRLWEPPVDEATELWAEGWSELQVRADSVLYGDFFAKIGYVERSFTTSHGRVTIVGDEGTYKPRSHTRLTILRDERTEANQWFRGMI